VAGSVLYGQSLGQVLIRIWGGLPEGVMYAILLMNALVPFINRATQPRKFGSTRQQADPAAYQDIATRYAGHFVDMAVLAQKPN
ncbi:MAG: RnfABCDGE type electron transport complex subunit D, partial [Abyssibacter sp.]|uniref:RnfABCDGE type electron transport complex subunit D n=1 Tax=Abyssibacter sp. TaxID=2320200 RepID=UPI00321B6E18